MVFRLMCFWRAVRRNPVLSTSLLLWPNIRMLSLTQDLGFNLWCLGRSFDFHDLLPRLAIPIAPACSMCGGCGLRVLRIQSGA